MSYRQPQSNNIGYSSYSQQQESQPNLSRPTPVPRTQPHLASHLPNLPANVKLPPSYNNHFQQQPQQQPREYGSRPHVPPRSIAQPSSNYLPTQNTPPVHHPPPPADNLPPNQSVTLADLKKLLEDTERENTELKNVINSNNEIMNAKLGDLEKLASELDGLKQSNSELQQKNSELTTQLSLSTNQFFEARVAVLGFKCRVMQLQAQENSPSKKQAPPPQQLGPHEINAQIGTLTQEKRQLLDENNSLMTVLALEREKITSLSDKKKIADEEAARLQAKVSQLETDFRLLEGRLGDAQNHSYQEHSNKSQLNQQLRSYEIDNKRLKNQLDEISHRETTLQSQVHGLKAKEKELSSKIHQLEMQSSATPSQPVPKRRTTLVNPLQAEVDRLKAELDKSRTGATALREKIESEREYRKTVEKTLDKKNMEYQELVLKYNTEKAKNSSSSQQDQVEHERLTRELSQLRLTENSVSQTVRQKDQQLQLMLGEKNDLQAKIASLEKQRIDELATARQESQQEIMELRRAKSNCEGKIANLTEQLRLAVPVQMGPKGGVSSSAMARRLNDALGNVKELEARLASQRSDFDIDRERWEREKQLLQLSLTRLEGEKQDKVEENLAFYKSEVDRLQAQESALFQQTVTLRENLDRARRDTTHKDDLQRRMSEEVADMTRQLTSQLTELQSVRSELESAKTEKDAKMTKLQQLANDCSELKSDKKRLSETIKDLKSQLSQANEVGGQKQELEAIVEELQGELIKASQEQEETKRHLHSCQRQVDQLSMTQQQLSAELGEKNARLKQVETQRDGVQERLRHMDAQLRMYQEDFERERQAREAAVKVRNMVEERIAKKEKEVKELRDRLNQQAMSTLRADDQYEETPNPSSGYDTNSHRLNPPLDSRSVSPSPSHSRSGEIPTHAEYQQPSSQDQGRMYHPPSGDQGRMYHPSSGDQGRGLHPSSGEHQKRRSQEQYFSGSHRQEPGAPPLPPRERMSAAGPGGYHPSGPHGFQSASHRGQFGGQPVPEQMWTQQLPATGSQQPMPRVRPMTSAQEVGTTRGGGSGLHTVTPVFQPQGGYPSQSDSGWRPPNEMRRNDLSGGGRNDLGGMSGGRNNLDLSHLAAPQQPQPTVLGGEWVGPGEVMNKAPPSMACPICGTQDFQTQTDLELHCAQCT